MRLFKISQTIQFRQDSDGGLFKKGQKVTFSGSLQYHNEIVIGYLKQEPITCNSLVLYVKGYWTKDWEGDNGELVLVETTKNVDNFSPFTSCSYFPYIINSNDADGYLDETVGITSKEGQYFFLGGSYIAKTTLQLKELQDGMDNLEYVKTKKKLNQMINRLYVSKNQAKLNFGDLFNFIQPHWGGAYRKLIDIYPYLSK